MNHHGFSWQPLYYRLDVCSADRYLRFAYHPTMNVYISFDMEGVTGVCHGDQVNMAHRDYPRYRAQLVREVRAACEGALVAGAERILVKDAHESGRNIDGRELPIPVELVSGWSGHPLHMVQEISDNFDAALFIGYHAYASSVGNPLAHTFSSKKVAALRLNGELASEYLVCAHAAEMFEVPVVLVSGDEALCAHVADHAPACHTVMTMRGQGPSITARHPDETVAEIRTSVAEALQGDLQACRLKRSDEYLLEIVFNDKQAAYRGGFYPGAEAIGQDTVAFRATDFFDILRAIKFLLY